MTAASMAEAGAATGTAPQQGELVVLRATGAVAATNVARRSAVSDHLESTIGLALGPGAPGTVVPLLGLEHCEVARLQIDLFDEVAGPAVIDLTVAGPGSWLASVRRTIDLLGVVELDAPPPPEADDLAIDLGTATGTGTIVAAAVQAHPTETTAHTARAASGSVGGSELARLDAAIAELHEQIRQDEAAEESATAAVQLRRSLQFLAGDVAVGSSDGGGAADAALTASTQHRAASVPAGRWFTPLVGTTAALLATSVGLLLSGHTMSAIPLSGLSLASGLLILLDPPTSRPAAGFGLRRLADALHDDEREQPDEPSPPNVPPLSRTLDDGAAPSQDERALQTARRDEARLRRERLEELQQARGELALRNPAPRELDEAPHVDHVDHVDHGDNGDKGDNGDGGRPVGTDAAPHDASAPSDYERLLALRRQRLALLHEQRRITERRAAAERRRDARHELARLEHLLASQAAHGWRRHASSLFAHCSAERYLGLDIGDSPATTVALQPDGTTVAVERLSRRYRQLVALSVRLAVAEVEHPGEPLVLDDVLVGLDDVLLTATCAALAELSDERPLFVCTGSARVAGALRRARRRARLVELR